MSPSVHKLYISTLTSIVVLATIFLIFNGSSYYGTELEERFYHPDHMALKPSGLYGHGLGIIGTLLILIGVFGYMIRKRYRSLAKFGALKYWLEFHIFLCVLGPIMILFHTAFKFGGIVSISFWSMVAVVASGVLGRFIYLQIPRTIQGRELSLAEVQEMKSDVKNNQLSINLSPELERLLSLDDDVKSNQDNGIRSLIVQMAIDFTKARKVHQLLKKSELKKSEINLVVDSFRNEMGLQRKINRLVTMQKYFRYWHIAHLPFALIMLIIMIIHVAVTLVFGYKWIF